MKSYTDLKQSKKLAEILPIESADMEYILEQWRDEETHRLKKGYSEYPVVKVDDDDQFQVITLPCWSLVALLAVIKPVNENTYTIRGTLDGGAAISFDEVTTVMFQEEEIIDAVFKMVVWLKENKLI